MKKTDSLAEIVDSIKLKLEVYVLDPFCEYMAINKPIKKLRKRLFNKVKKSIEKKTPLQIILLWWLIYCPALCITVVLFMLEIIEGTIFWEEPYE